MSRPPCLHSRDEVSGEITQQALPFSGGGTGRVAEHALLGERHRHGGVRPERKVGAVLLGRTDGYGEDGAVGQRGDLGPGEAVEPAVHLSSGGAPRRRVKPDGTRMSDGTSSLTEPRPRASNAESIPVRRMSRTFSTPAWP